MTAAFVYQSEWAMRKKEREDGLVSETRPLLVRLDALGKSYYEAGQEKCVLEAVDCSMGVGQFICLLGKVRQRKEHAPESHFRNRPTF